MEPTRPIAGLREAAELAARVRVELEKAGLHAVVYRRGEP
jgi:hypothetical protein